MIDNPHGELTMYATYGYMGLSYLYLDGDTTKALETINYGLSIDPDNQVLIQSKLQYDAYVKATN
jgi:hypothetical protein